MSRLIFGQSDSYIGLNCKTKCEALVVILKVGKQDTEQKRQLGTFQVFFFAVNVTLILKQ